MEISCLKNIGILETSVASARDPRTVSSASKAEAAPSIKRQDDRDSLGCWHPVSVQWLEVVKTLDKSEHEREAECKRLHRDIDAECGQSVSRDLSHGLKHSGATEAEDSAKHPRPKDRRTERGRSRECRHPDSPNCPPPPLHSYFLLQLPVVLVEVQLLPLSLDLGKGICSSVAKAWAQRYPYRQMHLRPVLDSS